MTSSRQQFRNEKVERPEHQPVAACSLCTHTGMDNKCSAYPDGIPKDILAGQDQHVKVRADQVGTDVFKLSLWKQFRNETFNTPEHRAPAGQFRVIACDTFEGPFADYLVGEFPTLDAAITAAERALSPMIAVYVYGDDGQVKFHELMSADL